MRIIGYGICGPGEANRYMRETLDCFARLCDEVVILCNNTGKAEHDLIDSYGFKRVPDRREWGRWQWKIKQDFLEHSIAPIASQGDMMVALDMDEVLDKELTREWLLEAPLEAYHVYVVDLWNDGYKPESCFWNVRLFKWNGITKFKPKPVHCGLAPEWTYQYHRFAPFLLKHYGLKEKDVRMKKIERYKKYDPHAEHLDKKYYDMLASDTSKPYDEDVLHAQIAKEVESYKQTKPREMTAPKPQRFAYIKNPHGVVLDIPEKSLESTMKRPGFTFIAWADDAQKDIEEMFEDVDVGEDDKHAPDPLKGSYQRSAADEKAELDRLNAKDEKSASVLTDEDIRNVVKEIEDSDRQFFGNIKAEDTLSDIEVVEAFADDNKPQITETPIVAPKSAVVKKPAKKAKK